MEQIINLKILGAGGTADDLGQVTLKMQNLRDLNKDLNQQLKYWQDQVKQGTPGATAEVEKLATQIGATKAAIKETASENTRMLNTFNAAGQASGSINDLSQKLSGMNAEIRKVSVGSTEWKTLKTHIDETREKLNKATESLGQHQHNVGNYLGSMKSGFVELAGAFGIGLGIDAIVEFGKKAFEAFTKAEQAENRLLFATHGNVEETERLTKLAKELEEKTGVNEEVIKEQLGILAVHKLTEEQLKKTITTAIDYAKINNVELPEAVKALSATWEGSLSKLAKVDGALKGLTVTQLKSGAAVDVLAKRYKNGAEAMELGTKKTTDKISNWWERALKNVGSVIAETFNHPVMMMPQDIEKESDDYVKGIKKIQEISKRSDDEDKKHIITLQDLKKELQTYKDSLETLDVTDQKGIATTNASIAATQKKIDAIEGKAIPAEKKYADEILRIHEQLTKSIAESETDPRKREQALLLADYQNKIAQLQGSFSKRAQSTQEFHQLMIEIEQDFERKLQDLKVKYADEDSKKDAEEKAKALARTKKHDSELLADKIIVEDMRFNKEVAALNKEELIKTEHDSRMRKLEIEHTEQLAAINEKDVKKQEELLLKVQQMKKADVDMDIALAKKSKQAWIDSTHAIIGAFADLAQTMGANAEAVKQIKVAESIIATYSAANKVLDATAYENGIIPGSAELQAAAVVVEGLANVIKIEDTKTGFQVGGYTGDGSPFDVAGLVHRGEYVIPAPMVRAMPQITSALENVRTGRAPGNIAGQGGGGAQIDYAELGKHVAHAIASNPGKVEFSLTEHDRFIRKTGYQNNKNT